MIARPCTIVDIPDHVFLQLTMSINHMIFALTVAASVQMPTGDTSSSRRKAASRKSCGLLELERTKQRRIGEHPEEREASLKPTKGTACPIKGAPRELNEPALLSVSNMESAQDDCSLAVFDVVDQNTSKRFLRCNHLIFT